MSEHIKYRAGYKYQLAETYQTQTNIIPPYRIITPFICLDIEGVLTVISGYAWDGPSGPTFDTKDFMRGSLVHDAFYQLMRENFLDHDHYRKFVDMELKRICLEDGMDHLRANAVYDAVRLFAHNASDPKHNKEVITAP
jgi:hypothetical protein